MAWTAGEVWTIASFWRRLDSRGDGRLLVWSGRYVGPGLSILVSSVAVCRRTPSREAMTAQ